MGNYFELLGENFNGFKTSRGMYRCHLVFLNCASCLNGARTLFTTYATKTFRYKVSCS